MCSAEQEIQNLARFQVTYIFCQLVKKRLSAYKTGQQKPAENHRKTMLHLCPTILLTYLDNFLYGNVYS